MIVAPSGVKVHIACGVTDMRKGIDGLATLVQEILHHDSFSGHLFAFRGGKANLIKILYWDGTETVALDAATVATVNGIAVTETDTYYWVVSYPGDTFNNPFGSGCGDEVTQLLAKDDKDEGGETRDDFTQ